MRKGAGELMTKVAAGIDVGKDHPDAHACGEARRFTNDRDGFRALDRWPRRHGAERVIMGSMGNGVSTGRSTTAATP